MSFSGPNSPASQPGQDRDDSIGGLSAATRLAVDRVYDDLYSDQIAYAAIERALPALTLSNPRELKRYVNVFRFYSFLTYRRALAGAPRATDDEVAKLAVLAIRWPHLLSLLARDWDTLSHPLADTQDRPGTTGRTSTQTVLEHLERAAACPEDQEWAGALAEAGLLRTAKAGTARWDALRAVLSARPSVARLARDLL